MSGVLNALLLAGGASILAGALAWTLARLVRRGEPDTDLLLWRTARAAVLLPLPLALIVHAIPQRVAAMAPALDFEPLPSGGHAPLPLAADAAQAGWMAGLPSLPAALLSIYLIGLSVSLVLAFARHLARRRMIGASRMADRDERRPLEALAERIGVSAPELRIGPDTASPVLTGWRGVVLVPEALLSRSDALHFALAHELTHLRRGDERDRLVGAALISLFWFNIPLRWIETELNAVREMACDRDTLEALGGARRKAYASALIETMRIAAPAASAFGPHDRRHREMRIKAIMTAPAARKGRAIWLAGTVLAATMPVAAGQALVTEGRAVAEVAEATVPSIPASAAKAHRAAAPVAPIAEPAPEPRPVPRAEPVAEAVPAPRAEPRPVSAPAPALTHRVAHGRISSRYGNRPARPADAPVFHYGTDIAAERGTPIVAPGAGVVVHAAAGFNGEEAWGNTVAIDHGNGWQTVYAHMEGFDVSVGDRVTPGQQIGRVGSTGRSTGPHVHVELRHHGERIDPAGYLPGL